jgi:hypothetical protein
MPARSCMLSCPLPIVQALIYHEGIIRFSCPSPGN